jgi:P-type Mg2+ transporter
MSIEKGLTNIEANIKLKQFGPNKISKIKQNILTLILEQFKNPILFLLIIATVFSFFTGEILNSIILIILITINSIIGFTQDYNSHQLAKKLESLIKKETLTLRDNDYQYILSENLVPGDIIKLKLGDLVPADLIVIESNSLFIDESTLTGETININKNQNDLLYSGTHIIKGHGIFKVDKTGSNSAIGNISNLALNTKKESEFSKAMAKLSRSFFITAFIFLISIFSLHFLLGKIDNLNTTLVFILALTISIIPEALPIVTSLTLSSKAYELGKKGLLVKRSQVLEDLGNMDIFCSDKTGTITQNQFKVVEDKYNIELQKYSLILAQDSNDSFDKAILKYFSNQITNQETNFEEIPFDPLLRISGRKYSNFTIWHGSSKEIINKTNLDQNQKEELIIYNENKEQEGIKCLAYALENNNNVEYLGSIYFADTLKDDADELINRCNQLHVALKILTGDSYNIAKHIGYQAKLINNDNQIKEASSLNFEDQEILYIQIMSLKIVARCTPEQKFKIIKALQTKKVVGYLGDGINDAPALKASQIGIVVNTSSDIAKETADIIMTNTDLQSLIVGIENGRKVYENINKYLKATLSSSFGNFFTIGLLSLILPYTPLLGIQIIISDLITDFPLISISKDNVSKKDIRKPKHQNLTRLILICLLLGLISSLFDFIFLAINKDLPVPQIQTSWFLFSILTELVIIFSIRTKKPFFKATRPEKMIIFYSIIAFIISIFIATFAFKYINIATISMQQTFILIGLSLGYFTISEIVKVIYYRHFNTSYE